MKTRIVVLLVVAAALAIVGCRHLSKRPATKLPPAPLPPGFKTASQPRSVVPVVTLAPSYVPTDFALVSVKAKQGSVVLTWINGSPPFQVESRPDVLSLWVSFGPSTTLRSMTNPAPYGFTKALFRVKSIATTPGALHFVKQSTAGAAGNARAFKCAADRSGNVYVVGMFVGTVDWGAGSISSSGTLDDDAFITKYDVSGRALWSKRIGGPKSDQAKAVAVDSQGSLIVGGHFTGDVDFGGARLVSIGLGSDAFVAKYSTAGALIWAKKFGGTNSSFDRCSAVAIDSQDNVLFTALFDSPAADFGGIVLATAGLEDIAICKLSGSTGATLWAKRHGGANNDRPNGIAVNASGDAWVTGNFAGTTDLGSGPIAATPAANRIFLSRYSGADGGYRNGSVRTMGTTSFNSGNGITVDSATGNVLVTGACVGAVDFGGGLVLNAGETNGSASFIAVYGSAGNYLWAKVLGDGFTIGTAFGSAVVSDGAVAMTGYSPINIFLGAPGWLNGHGYYTLSFDTGGVFRWGKFSSGGPSEGQGITFDSAGHVVTAGYASGLVNFGPGPDGQNIIGNTPNGVPSSFVGQYSQ